MGNHPEYNLHLGKQLIFAWQRLFSILATQTAQPGNWIKKGLKHRFCREKCIEMPRT